jgi:UDP-3-O-[3-hydroxymyristoyl] glucosamine N-acyltransferase
MNRVINIKQICKKFNLIYFGDDIDINGLGLCNRLTLYDSVLSYVTSKAYIQLVRDNKSITALIIQKEYLESYRDSIDREITYILSESPEYLFYEIHHYLYEYTDFYNKNIEKTKVGNGCTIHPSSIISSNGVVIGENVIIEAGTIIKPGTIISNNVIIKNNNVIGNDGFQVIKYPKRNMLIKHCGGVIIDENTVIGDSNVINKSLFEGFTTIGKNVMIDSQVYIAHNCNIKDDVIITSGCKLFGSSVIEKGAWVGGGSTILNRVVVGQNSYLGIGSVVTRDVPPYSVAYGVPAKMRRQDDLNGK